MSNYPLGAENDPKAPWNEADNEPTYEELLSQVNGELANELPQVIWKHIKNWVADDEMRDDMYIEIMDIACEIWDKSNNI